MFFLCVLSVHQVSNFLLFYKFFRTPGNRFFCLKGKKLIAVGETHGKRERHSDPEGVAVWGGEEYRDAFSVGILIVIIRGWRSSSLPTAINLLPFGQRRYLVAAASRAVLSVVKNYCFICPFN